LIVRESSDWICTVIERSPDGAKIIRDPRFVKLGRRERELDWRRGAHGGRDYWARAEECVAVRRRRVGEADGKPLVSPVAEC
jgi:hypothetical protein